MKNEHKDDFDKSTTKASSKNNLVTLPAFSESERPNQFKQRKKAMHGLMINNCSKGLKED